jgi:hypothetical protein
LDSTHSSNALLLAGADRFVHSLDVRTWKPLHSVSSRLKYEVTALHVSAQDENVVFASSHVDTEVACLGWQNKERRSFARMQESLQHGTTAIQLQHAQHAATTEKHAATTEQQQLDTRAPSFSSNFRADGRWLGLCRMVGAKEGSDDQDTLVGLTAQGSIYVMQHATQFVTMS